MTENDEQRVKPSEQRGGTTPGSADPATDGGIDPEGGDAADATTDGGPELPEGAEPDLKDAPAASRRPD